MGLFLSCSVLIWISNKTGNITLKNASTYLYCGDCTHSFLPEMSPGSSGICHFSGNSRDFWAVSGILVYEAESFTLAIYFSNPIDYSKLHVELGLELSPGKVHLGKLEDTYTHMANGTYSSSHLDIKFSGIIRGKNHGTVQVSDDPIKVTATMSNTSNSFLEVMLEEQGGLGKEVGIESCDLEKIEKLHSLKTRYQEK